MSLRDKRKISFFAGEAEDKAPKLYSLGVGRGGGGGGREVGEGRP